MKQARLLLLAVLLAAMVVATNAQITSTSTGGNWSDAGTWVGGSVPASGDVVIADGATVIINQNLTIANLTVGGGTSGKLYFDGTARTVAISGNITVNTGGSFIVYNIPTTTGDMTLGSSTVTVASTAGISVGTSITGVGLDSLATVTAINGSDLTLSYPATATQTGVTLYVKPTGSVTVGTFTISNVTSTTGIVTNMGCSNSGYFPSGTLITTVGATDLGTSAAAGKSGTLVPLTIRPIVTHSLSLGGNLTNNGTFDMSVSSSTLICNITFNKNGDQTISGSGTLTRFRGIALSKTAKANKVICSIDVLQAGSSLFIPTGSTGTWEQTAGTFTSSNSQTNGVNTALNIITNANLIIQGNLTIVGSFLVNTTGILTIGTLDHKLDIATAGASGTLTAGTINIIGKMSVSGVANVLVNGANININANTLVASEYAFRVTTGTGGTNPFTFTSGTITILNPTGVPNTVGEIAMTSMTAISGTAKFVLGQGASTVAGTSTGFKISSNATINSLVINTGSVGVVIQSNTLVTGTLTYISSGSIGSASGTAFAFRYGTAVPTTGTLEYLGTPTQQIIDTLWVTGSQYRPLNVIVNNATGLTMNSGRVLPGNLTITNGTLADGGNTLTVYGSIVNNGTHSGAGKIRLENGTASRTLSGNGVYENLDIADSYGATLTGNTTINGTLYLTGGTLTNGSYLTLGNGATLYKIGGNLTATPTFGTSVNLTIGKSNTSTWTTTLGSTSVTMGTSYPPGYLITGTGIPANTTVVSVLGNIATLSNAATATGSASMSITWPNVITANFELPSVSTVLSNFIINNAAGAALGASVVVNGTLTLTSGTLADAGYTLTAKGNVSNNATHSGAGKILLSGGSTAHTLSGTGTYGNLELDDTFGALVTGSPVVSGTLTLTSGNIALNAQTLTLGNSTSILGALAGSGGYMIGSGTLKRWFGASTISGTEGTFPMGVGTNNRAVSIGGTTTAGGTVSVSYKDSSTVSTFSFVENAQTFVNRYNAYWTVAVADGFTSSDASLAINGNGIPGITAIGDLNVSGETGAAPGKYTATTGTTSAPVVNRTELTEGTLPSIYYIAATITSPLPVELTSFTGSVSQKQVVLNWSTATEKNNYGFAIERKSANTGWEKVGFVAGSGTSNEQHSYSFTNAVQTAAKYAYRLKQMDNDGKFEYSKEVEAVVALVASDYGLGQNYPNPFNPSTTFSFAVKAVQHVSLKVYNLVGQEVGTLFEGMANADEMYTVKFDAKDLASGIYMSVLTTSDKREVRKMMLMK